MAMLMIAMLITGINLILIGILLVIYFRNYREMKANFNLGLLMFASFLVTQKIISLIFFLSMMSHDDVLGTPMFVLELLELLGFSSLFWITIR